MVKRILSVSIIVLCGALIAFAQQAEQRMALTDAATGADTHGAPAIEARLVTTLLNGAEDSPVTNVKLVVRNVSPNFFTYVTGWAMFYDASGVRCGEGLFKVDALAVNESAATDTPGLRLRCSPATWRIVPTNLLTRTVDEAKPEANASLTETARPGPTRFMIVINGEEHPIQLNHPIEFTMGSQTAKIVLRSAP